MRDQEEGTIISQEVRPDFARAVPGIGGTDW